MNDKQFASARKALLAEKTAFEQSIDERYTEVCKTYVNENCQYKINQVVDIGKGKRTKRMAIYQISPTFLFDDAIPSIVLYGWYLDEQSKPIKWEGNGIFLTGISNPQPVKLSENQEHTLRSALV